MTDLLALTALEAHEAMVAGDLDAAEYTAAWREAAAGDDEVDALVARLVVLVRWQDQQRERVTLEPGQKRTVTFTLDASDFGFYDNSGRFVVEPGRDRLLHGHRRITDRDAARPSAR